MSNPMQTIRQIRVTPITTGRYSLRAAADGELGAALGLRGRCFGAPGARRDGFDATATHVLVHDRPSGTLVATYRLGLYRGAQIRRSYAAQYYDTDGLSGFAGPMLELGRFCVHPDWHDPDILRLAWAGMTGVVDDAGVTLLFGCTSFEGTDTAPYEDGFALLRARHLGPAAWRPGVRARDVHAFGALAGQPPDIRKANAALPPLLRTYLVMGGWVSDHAVIDRVMHTVHVFTAVEIAAIPAGRKRLLRALAGG